MGGPAQFTAASSFPPSGHGATRTARQLLPQHAPASTDGLTDIERLLQAIGAAPSPRHVQPFFGQPMVGTSPAASTSPASFEPPLPTQPATPPVYAPHMPQQSPHVQPCNMTQPVVGTSQTMSANHPFADVRPAQFSPQQQTTPQQPHQPQPQPRPSSDSEFRSPAEPQPRPQQTPQVPSRPISPPPQDATPSSDFSSETRWPCISATQTLSKCEDKCEGFRGALGSTFPFVVHSRDESEVVKAVNKYAAGYFEVAKTSGRTGG